MINQLTANLANCQFSQDFNQSNPVESADQRHRAAQQGWPVAMMPLVDHRAQSPSEEIRGAVWAYPSEKQTNKQTNKKASIWNETCQLRVLGVLPHTRSVISQLWLDTMMSPVDNDYHFQCNTRPGFNISKHTNIICQDKTTISMRTLSWCSVVHFRRGSPFVPHMQCSCHSGNVVTLISY